MFIAELFNGAPKHAPAPEQTYVEDSSPQLVVLYPGRFQPFHLGHSDVFNSLQSKFGRGNVYISTSNKTEEGRSPFNFSDKLVFMTAAGVPVDRVLENTSPYKLPPQFDPANTILVVAVGAPDADRLRPGSYKKDGQPGYYQKFDSIEKCTTSDKHGYVIVAAERKKVVTIGGKQYDASHGTTVRNLWNAIRNKPQQRAEFISQMFGRNDPEVGRVLDKIDLSEAAGEVALPVDSISPIHGGINESCVLRFGSIDLEPSQISAYAKKFFECHNIDQPHTKFINNVKRLGSNKLIESNEINEIKPFVDMIKSIDSPQTIEIGDHFAVLAFELIFAYKEINVRGFTVPKEVSAIKLNNDGSINYVTFTDGDRYPRVTPARYQGKPLDYAVYFNQQSAAESALTALTLKVPAGWDIDSTDIERSIAENDDPFAPSDRVFNQVQQDRHPLSDYLTFEDYDHLMDEFADTQSAVKTDAELDAYLEKFESGLRSAAIPQEIVEIVEEFVHGRHGKYGTEVPRRNQLLLSDLNNAFSRIWMDYKPDRFVKTLARHMSLACVAAINEPNDNYDSFNEDDDDLFAPSKSEKISMGLTNFAKELQSDLDAAHPSWAENEFNKVEQEKIKFVLFLAENFKNRSKVPYTLNYIARVLNGDSGVVEYYKKHAIWDADDYLKEKIGHGFAELFNEYKGQLDESDDMFSNPGRVASAAKRNVTSKIAARGRASRKTDTELQEIVKIAESMLGSKYSSGTISGGKVYRISLFTRGLERMYHYGSLSQVSDRDKLNLAEQKKKFFKMLEDKGIDTSRVEVKYHMGASLYTSVRVKMKDIA